VLDTDRDETEVEASTDVDVLDEEALPRITEPEIPEEERTKPDGIKLRDEARYMSGDYNGWSDDCWPMVSPFPAPAY
jgi:hypothetical protein